MTCIWAAQDLPFVLPAPLYDTVYSHGKKGGQAGGKHLSDL